MFASTSIVAGARRSILATASFLSLLILAACGGGGGGSDGGSPPPPVGRQAQTAVFIATEPNTQDRHLFSAADDGTSLTQLTPNFTTSNGTVLNFSVSPDGRTIAYSAVATTENVVDVYLIPVAGGTPVQVSSGFPDNTRVRSLDWSPDSSQLAYVANPLGYAPRGFGLYEVFLVNRDGSNNRKINGSIGSPPAVAVIEARWSPDSRYVAQGVYSLDPFQVLIGINTHDTSSGVSNSTRVNPSLNWLNGERLGYDWTWSPDSTRIAFRSRHRVDDQMELFTVTADGSTLVNIMPLSQGKDITRFEWSPNSDRLAYWGDVFDVNKVELFTSRSDGSNHIRLSKNGSLTSGQLRDIHWLPDSTELIYSLDQDISRTWEYFLADISSRLHPKIHRDLVAGEAVADVSVSPDGRYIAFRSNIESDQAELFVVDADLSNQRKISGPIISGGYGVMSYTWSPDSSRIAYTADRNISPGVLELFVATVDGLTDNQVSPALPPDHEIVEPVAADWSKDSTRILFRTIEGDGPFRTFRDLWVGKTDGSAPIKLNGTNEEIVASSY